MRWMPATGKVLWRFEPQIDFKNARSACCDIVNRGVSVWKGKVYVATFDGILYALDARDGKVLWQADTIADRSRAYSVTGAPQVAGKVVVIGNGGAEYDSRGYVTAYDLETGKQAWRFYTVPRDPKLGPEGAALGWHHGQGRRDLAWHRLGSRRRRQCLGCVQLRSRAQPRLLRHRQRRAVEPRRCAARAAATTSSSPPSSR